jgi:N-carbamoyl-L-amino-acid hydrolase
VITGSHLDSVPDGGAFDGPLGVVTALAAIDVMRDRGIHPRRPIGIAVFSDEEGARFGMPCLGSRLMTGVVTPERAAELRDGDGVFLFDAMAGAGFHGTPGPSMDHLHDPYAFVELHVEQGRGLIDLGRPIAVGSAIWPHGRWRFAFTGEADHAGTTRMEDRHDPMLTYAMTALAANKQARLADVRATFGRLTVEPNGTNAIPSQVTAWLDARAEDTPALEALVEVVRRQASERADRDGTMLEVVAESVSPAVELDLGLRDRIVATLDGAPVLGTGAGHDAGILASAGVPTAMLFVRNPTGVSHSPAEHAERADCHAGVEALATVLADLSA